MDYKAIFNKQFCHPYADAQYEPENIKELLTNLAKKFTENLLYNYKINIGYLSRPSYHITIMVPPFYDLQIFYHRTYFDSIIGYFIETFYIYKKNNLYYKIYNFDEPYKKNNYFYESTYKNNKYIYSKTNNHYYKNTNPNLISYTYVYNDKYFTEKIIYYDKNNIEMISYWHKNDNLTNNVNYIFTYDLNYIYMKKEPIGNHNKFISNFLIIILFI
jgi:hypothetical protein